MTQADEALLALLDDPSLPAHALPSEEALLGSVLWHGPHVAHPVIAADFYREWHRELFQIVCNLYAANPHIAYLDPIAVKDELFRLGRPLDATPMFLLYDHAIHCGVSDIAARYHVERVLDAAETRLVQDFGKRLAQVGDRRGAAAAVQAELDAALSAFRLRIGERTADTHIAEIARTARLAAAAVAPAMSTGLADLDDVLNGGLRPSTFNVVGARPGVGKSLLVGSIARHVGAAGSARVLYVTLELTAAEVTNRLLSAIGGVELTAMQNPDRRSQQDWARLDHAEQQIADWHLHVDDSARTIGQIEATARAHLATAPAGLLIVDYLQRITEDGSSPNRERHVATCANRLTELAHELRVPVVCVVSFSRDSARRGGPPRMDDIRDSGNVESDADTVLLLWQPDANDGSLVEGVVDKNRYGQLGTVQLRKQGHRGRIVSAARGGWAA